MSLNTENKQPSKKGMRKNWMVTLVRRRFTVILLLFVQLFIIVNLIITSTSQYRFAAIGLEIISVLVAIYVIATKTTPENKLTWVFVILLVPVFGGLFYLIITFQTRSKGFKRKVDEIEMKARKYHFIGEHQLEEVAKKEELPYGQIKYLDRLAGFPVSNQTEAKYLNLGERFFEALLPELEKAEKYIFLEFFIIKEGIMWDKVLEILERKVKAKVLVRVMYDDIGCFLSLPKDYKKQLEEKGIECTVFHPFVPILSSVQNNRDHRKIVSIDGKVAFTGGINLSDEYINAYEKHGHWKDTAIMINGKAAWDFVVIFLTLWNTENKINEDLTKYHPGNSFLKGIESDGYFQPYADNPLDNEFVSESVFLHIIQSAKKYVYICTPYLIVGDKIISALKLAAKSGVDVRIITPHKWDKWYVHVMTISFYRELINAGVRLYEYSKGFMHAKSFVSDDMTGLVGTTNLDYRSLYLHFECGICFYNTSVIKDVKEDFLETLKSCQEINVKDTHRRFITRMVQDVFRIFAPLL